VKLVFNYSFLCHYQPTFEPVASKLPGVSYKTASKLVFNGLVLSNVTPTAVPIVCQGVRIILLPAVTEVFTPLAVATAFNLAAVIISSEVIPPKGHLT